MLNHIPSNEDEPLLSFISPFKSSLKNQISFLQLSFIVFESKSQKVIRIEVIRSFRYS